MTLLESTYRQLHSAGLVNCAEAFSKDYLGKNRNWYALQKHTGREISVGAAVQCLRSIRKRLAEPALDMEQRNTLAATEVRLVEHLNEAHLIADVC